MNRPKLSKNNYLLLALCVIGVFLVAWWAWAAGPVQSRSSAVSLPDTSAKSLSKTTSSSLSPNVGTGPSANPGQSTSTPSISPQLPPTNPQPSYPDCTPIGAQTDLIYYPCGCQAVPINGCGCTPKPGMLCPMPLY